MPQSILLLGKNGQLGWELHRALLPLGEVTALDYPQIDMSDPASIRSVARSAQFNLIINATAYTDVDKAEQEPGLAEAINAIGTGILAEEALRQGAFLIHYSTDYVFDGMKAEPYTEEDEPNPVNVYGRTKLAGEQATTETGADYLVFRTSWVYSLRRDCFVTKVLQWARQQETLRIVDDQVSSPTSARLLAEMTAQIIAQGRGDISEWLSPRKGLYHLAGGGSCSRYEWAKAILALDPNKEEQVVKGVIPVQSDHFVSAADRPYRTVLSCRKFEDKFGLQPPQWDIGLQLALN